MLNVFALLETDKFSQRLRAGLVADILKNLLEDLNQLGLDFLGHAAQGGALQPIAIRGCATLQGQFWKASFPQIGCDFIKFTWNRVWCYQISLK